ncbi:hypothetical protein EV182_003469, partial [Spiromyces aspiralis]
ADGKADGKVGGYNESSRPRSKLHRRPIPIPIPIPIDPHLPTRTINVAPKKTIYVTKDIIVIEPEHRERHRNNYKAHRVHDPYKGYGADEGRNGNREFGKEEPNKAKGPVTAFAPGSNNVPLAPEANPVPQPNGVPSAPGAPAPQPSGASSAPGAPSPQPSGAPPAIENASSSGSYSGSGTPPAPSA